MSIKKKLRSVDGVLLLDKPKKLTSNAALQRVKHLYEAKKAGHSGTLDPLATGMLVVCFGSATKFSQYLLESDKSYFVVAQLGTETTTGDADGEVTKTTEVQGVDRTAIEAALAGFQGQIDQVPSMYSSLKHQGTPLYELARKGITIERDPRRITIYRIHLVEHTETTFTFEVTCSKGTYIRTLVEDIGHVLGCGAHVTELKRTMVGPYRERSMLTMDQLMAIKEEQSFEGLDDQLRGIDSMITHWPMLSLSESAVFYIKNGQLIIDTNAPEEGLLRLYDYSGNFLGIGEAEGNGRVVPKRLF